MGGGLEQWGSRPSFLRLEIVGVGPPAPGSFPLPRRGKAEVAKKGHLIFIIIVCYYFISYIFYIYYFFDLFSLECSFLIGGRYYFSSG